MTKWKLNFEIDFRAVQLFRLLLGATIALDMIQRILIAEIFYSDAGLLPRALIAAKSASFISWSSPFFAFGSALWSQSLFAIMLVLGLALMFGFKARTMSFLLFFLTVSMQVRAPLVLYGADTVSRVMLFWSIFLPSRPSSADYKISNAVSAAVLFQLAIVYIFSGWLKSTDAYFYQPTAVYHALTLNSYASSFGHFIVRFPELLRFASRVVLVIERFGWILFFIPWKRDLMRIGAFGLFALLHVGFYLCFNIGLFPFLNLIFLVLLLPQSVFSKRVLANPHERLPGRTAEFLAPAFVALFFCLNLSDPEAATWNVSLRRALHATGLNQSWSFFAPYPFKQEGEWIISGRDADGASADLTKIIFPSGTLGRLATRRYSENLMHQRPKELLRSLARYACRRWNRLYPDAPMKDINILLALRIIPDPPNAPYFHFEPAANVTSPRNLSSCDMKLFTIAKIADRGAVLHQPVLTQNPMGR
jgi:hypothetical protein